MANAEAVGNLIIALGLDPEDVVKALDRVDKQISDTFSKMPDTVDKSLAQVDAGFRNVFGGIMRNLIAPLTSALAVRSLFGNYLKGADALGKASQRLGVNGEELQAWGEAAKRAGGSSDAFQGSIQQLNRGIQEFKTLGEGRSKKVLEAMGFTQSSFDAAKGGTADVFEVLTKLSEKAEGMDKMQFNAFASKLGLDQGTISLLQQGSKGLEEAIRRQKEFGTYSERDMEITARFNDTIDDMNQSFQAASAIVLRVVVPVLTKFSEKTTEAINFMRDHEPFAIAFFTGLAVVLTATLLPAIEKVGAGFLSWVKNNPILAALSLVILGIALVIDDLITYANGGKSAFEGFWKLFGTADQIKEKIENLKNDFKAFLDDTLPRLMRLGAVLATGYAALVLYKGAVAIFNGVTAAIKLMNLAIAANPAGIMFALLITIATWVILYWDKILATIKSVAVGAKAAWDSFFGWIGGMIDTFSEKWGKFKSFFGFGDKGGNPAGTSSGATVIAPSLSGTAATAIKPSSVTNNNKVQSSSETNIGQISINTQATDAKGIANNIGDAMQERIDNMYTAGLVNSGQESK